MDEKLKKQLDSIKLDVSDEIEARDRLRSRRQVVFFGGMGIGEAIVLAAVILVVGIWGGKLAYDHYQARQMERALIEFSNSMKRSMESSSTRMQQNQERARQQQVQREQARVEQINQERQLREEAEQQRLRELRLASDQCRFWNDQFMSDPSERNQSMINRHCK